MGGVSLWMIGGVSLWMIGGVSLWSMGGVSLWSMGGVSLWMIGGVSLWSMGGVSLWMIGGVSLWMIGGVSLWSMGGVSLWSMGGVSLWMIGGVSLWSMGGVSLWMIGGVSLWSMGGVSLWMIGGVSLWSMGWSDICRGYAYKKTKRSGASCRGYWDCSSGTAIAKCCAKGYAYNPVTHRCHYQPGCVESCLSSYTPTSFECPNGMRAVPGDKTKYEVKTGPNTWTRMPCPPTLGFSVGPPCGCNVPLHDDQEQECRPELYLPFTDNDKDQSGRQIEVKNEGVIVQDGKAFFNGESRLIVNRFSNTWFGRTVYVQGEGWQDVLYRLDDDTLTGYVNAEWNSEPAKGVLQSRKRGLIIGSGGGCEDFTGFIDEVIVFLCRPDYKK
nr:hypothetical protein BaRGS_025066 [Batillaria attramentaria]